MMWVLYEPHSFRVVDKFYSKKAAKEKIKTMYRTARYTLKLENLDGMTLEQWKTWKVLQRK